MFGSARSYARSQFVGIKTCGAAGTVLLQGFLGESFERGEGTGKCGIPSLFRTQLFKDGGSEFVLLLRRELRGNLESLL